MILEIYTKMETHKRIYNKLADKVELASEKIELSAIDDLKKAINEAERIKSLQEDGFKWYDKETHKRI